MTPVVCDNLWIYNIIPRSTIKEVVQRDDSNALQVNQNITPKCFNNLPEGRIKKTEKHKLERTNRKQIKIRW